MPGVPFVLSYSSSGFSFYSSVEIAKNDRIATTSQINVIQKMFRRSCPGSIPRGISKIKTTEPNPEIMHAIDSRNRVIILMMRSSS